MLRALVQRLENSRAAAALRAAVHRFPASRDRGRGLCDRAAGRRDRRLAVERAPAAGRAAQHRRRAAHGRDGPGHRLLRRRRRPGLHHLRRAALRRLAGRRLAAPGAGAPGDRGPAVPDARWRRRRAHRRGHAGQPARGPAGPGRQHHHPAARPPELPHPRQDLHPQGAGGAARGADRAAVHQGPDPRAVPEQDVFRRRALRRRGGGTGLLREAGPRAHRGRVGAARRAGEVAVHVGAVGEHGAGRGPAQRRAAGDARPGRHRRGRPSTRARDSVGDAARRARAATSHSASTSRSRCGRS